jgi:hypothetical protein
MALTKCLKCLREWQAIKPGEVCPFCRIVCAFCGEEYSSSLDREVAIMAMTNHIAGCDKHPLGRAIDQLAAARERIAALEHDAEVAAEIRGGQEAQIHEDAKAQAELSDANRIQARRIAELRSVVEKLPKTMDGVSIVPSLMVVLHGTDMSGEIESDQDARVTSVCSDHAWVQIDDHGDQECWPASGMTSYRPALTAKEKSK